MNSQTPAGHQDLGLLIGAGADHTALATFLDALDDAARVREVRSLARKDLGALYERCASAPPLRLADFVPDSVPVGKTIICAGLNNLPMFRTFEKRLVRTPSGQVFGFNFQSMSFITGPGYFAITESGNELLFDYTKVPSQSDVPRRLAQGRTKRQRPIELRLQRLARLLPSGISGCADRACHPSGRIHAAVLRPRSPARLSQGRGGLRGRLLKFQVNAGEA